MTSARKIKQRQRSRLARLNSPNVETTRPMMEIQQVEEMLDEIIQEVESVSVSTTASVAPAKVAVQLSEKAIKLDSELVEAVNRLTESMNFRAKEERKTGIRGWAQAKVEDAKQLFTLPGIARAAGLGQDPSSLLGSILAEYETNQERKRERLQEKAKYVAEFSELTDIGRGMSKRDAMVEGSRRFEELQKLQPELESLEAKERRARDFGGSLSESDLARKNELLERRKQLQNYSREQVEPSNQRGDLIRDFKQGVLNELSELNPEERQKFMSQDPEMIKGIFEGAISELVELSDKQLEQLNDIKNILHKSEEEIHEANLRKSNQPLGVLPSSRESNDNKEGGIASMLMSLLGAKGLMGKLGGLSKGLLAKVGLLAKTAIATIAGLGKAALTGLMGLVSGAGKAIVGGLATAGKAAMGGLAKLVPLAGKAVLPAAAVAGAGYAGWRIGGWLNENVVDPAVRRLTGDENQTLGGWIYDKLNPGDPMAEPVETPQRVQQTRRTRSARRAAEAAETIRPETNAPVINNVSDNRSTVVNNSTVMQVPVRNQEPALNRRLQHLLAS